MKLTKRGFQRGRRPPPWDSFHTTHLYESGEVLSFKDAFIPSSCLSLEPPDVIQRSGKGETYLEPYSLES